MNYTGRNSTSSRGGREKENSSLKAFKRLETLLALSADAPPPTPGASLTEHVCQSFIFHFSKQGLSSPLFSLSQCKYMLKSSHFYILCAQACTISTMYWVYKKGTELKKVKRVI